jgi:hypothetical protein
VILTFWRHVRPGATVVINGVHWVIDLRTATTITMHRDGEPARTGRPDMDAAVAVLEPWAGQESATEHQAVALVTTALGGIELDAG